MKNSAAGIALLLLMSSSVATAALNGNTYDFSTAQTGAPTITPLGVGGSYAVPAGPGFCVGPGNCAGGGMSGTVAFSGNQITFTFFGSTFFPAGNGDGTFVLNLTNFLPANIESVTYNSGSLSHGSFGLTSFTTSSMVFTGTSARDGFNAEGGRTIVFDLVTAGPPTVTKTFTPAKITPSGTSTLSIAITNPSATVALSNVSFTDTYPLGLVTANVSNLASNCEGAAVASAGALSLSGGALAAGGSCTVSATVVGLNVGARVNSVTVSSNLGSASPASATLFIAAPPTLSKSFSQVAIGAGGTATLTFKLANPNNIPLTGLAFTDPLPAGLVVATPAAITTVCDGAIITAVPGSGVITLSGTNLVLEPTCNFTVNVTSTGTPAGLLTNTTSTLTSNEAPAGAAATAAIHVGDPFQVSYFSNLNLGDSVINITNPGSLGAALPSGISAVVLGAVCVNVYAFSPDEQLISCCSCPVTPNALVSLSVQQDLISNTLTPAVPTSVVVKLLATVPVAGSCVASAAAASDGTLASSLKAWGTKLHAVPPAGRIATTETSFSGATLSTGELSRISQLCTYANANGSGFGICRSCRLGGLGAGRL